jgi:PAS domain S-box-containing protein
MSGRYRVLLVEDCAQDARLSLRQLERAGLEVEHERVETPAEMQAALQAKPWDFILCDYHLPRFDGLAALALYKESGLDIPFIILSGVIGEEQAVRLIKAGAHEYVMKDNLAGLAPAVKRELQAAEERCIKRRTEAREAFLVSLVQSCDEAIIGQTLEGSIVSWNHGAQRIYGYSPSEILGSSFSVLIPKYQPWEHPEILEKVGRGDGVAQFETVHLNKNGTPIEVSLTVSPIRDPRGRIIGASSVTLDITERKLEEAERLGLIEDLTAALAKLNNPEDNSLHTSCKIP